MSWVRGCGTKPEMIVRRLFHSAGYHYRLHWRTPPEAADLIFRGRKLAIFVHGCFWHRHADPHCPLARLTKSKLDFWDTKLETNRNRDERNLALLAAIGWGVLEIWECQTKNREKLQVGIIPMDPWPDSFVNFQGSCNLDLWSRSEGGFDGCEDHADKYDGARVAFGGGP